MPSTITVLLSLPILVISQMVLYESNNTTQNEVHNLTCPTWTYQTEDSCKCGNCMHDIVICNQVTKEVRVMKCYCMTVSEVDNISQTLLGNCMFNCGLNSSIKSYYSASHNPNTLNNRTCGIYNRDGQMCSKCRAGYGVAAYTHSNNCSKCVEYRYNWIKYTVIAFAPLTVFYMTLVILRIDATNTILSSYILVSQIVTAPIMATLHEYYKSEHSISVTILVTIHGIWNLDFGRLIYEPFCLHPDLTTHQVVALDYLIAVYPLLLILLTYFLVKLHDNYRLAVIIWSPCYWCIRRIQKEWNIKASLVDVFATFLLLSNVKLLNVSFDLISVPVTLKNATGHSMPLKYTYLNGSLEYLGREHLPYFVLGVVVILVFNVLPILLLCLYPFRCFQRCLNCCSLSRPSLHIFMDAFQGCYKTAPCDYRSLSAITFIFRLVNFLLFYFTINPTYFTLLGMTSVSLAFFVMLVQPYKLRQQTNMEGLLLLMLGALAFLLNSSKEIAHVNKNLYFGMKFWIAMLPNIVLAVWISYKLFTKNKYKDKLMKPIMKRIRMSCIANKEDVPLLTTDLQ